MSITLSLSLACAAFACGPADTSEQAEKAAAPEGTEASATSEDRQETAKSTPARMVAFDGAHDFMKTSRRLRIWRDAVDLDMIIDAEGEATDCKVVDEFRKTYVNIKLCEVAMAHYTFEPARNAHDEAVEGSYRAHISYAKLREELD
jgi:hypothetical protein